MNDVSMPGLIVPIEARIDKLEKGLERANRAQRRAAQGMERRAKQSADRIGKTYGKMGDAMAGAFKRMSLPLLAGIGSAATVQALRETTRGIAEIGNEAKRAGVPLRDFQEWRYVAEANRIGIDAMTDGLREMNIQADEFITTGGGTGAEAFARLGYGADELREKLKDPSDLLLEIMGRMKRLNVAARIRVADELFGGTAGERFVELVDQGEDGLRRTVDRAHELGLVLGDDVIAKADEVSRKFDELTARIAMFGKRVAVAVADGVVEIADLRSKLDDIFPGEKQGRAVLGDDLYDALEKNRDVVDAQERDLGALRKSYDQLGDAVRLTAAQLLQASNLARSWGYDEAATELAGTAAEMITLADEFAKGTLTGEDFAQKLDEVQTAAAAAFDTLEEADKVEFGNAISQVMKLGGVLQTVLGLASSLKGALADAAGVEAPKTPMQTFREADAQSMRDWKAEKAKLDEFLSGEAERNAMSRERLTIEREIASVMKRAAAEGVTLTREQAEVAATAKIAADVARSNAGKGGGGKGDTFGRAVQSIIDETKALELEAAAMMAAAAAGTDYEMAIEVARREAELLHSAQMQGLSITPALRSEISRLAQAYADSSRKADLAAEGLRKIDDARMQIENSAATAFEGLITGTMSFREAMANLMKDLARYAAQKFFLRLLGGLAGGGQGWLNSFASVLSGGFASGGYTGDGGKFEPAGVVHKGEYVLSKEATRRIGVGNLEALHSAAKRGYASGGLVGGAAPLRSAQAARSGPVEDAGQVINISAPVTVNGSAGSPEQNNDLAKKMAREMEMTMRGVVVDEIRKQGRPGNLLNNRGRR
ncbi:hypothetical protein PXK01_05865 [Phaeobacter sp. PT47_59]|uniref:hypothetical protein n=1 Tax=Phaeobacter sp. PT47_59 TaxID=3029979 RepID=UPI0023807215|nr:hypothetical protein [Phaeobacter sp. PT47_59]MDE4173671.1 hypothetical protein [Phaeobacter sp. PT47_59]